MTIHRGISTHRFKDNPLEEAYAKEWERQAPNTLGWLICRTHDQNANYTERDAEVAATMIQWLGSPVGSSFVQAILESQGWKVERTQ